MMLRFLILSTLCMTIHSTGQGDFSPNPTPCKQDAFTASEPYQGKVFLYPWRTEDRKGDWYYNRAYCAKHCAEMVTLHNETENNFFYNFMQQVGMRPQGVWLGAQVSDTKQFTHWHNNEMASYQPLMPGEYDQPGLTCVDMSFYAGERKWRNWYCASFPESNNHHIACQRKETSTADDDNCDWTLRRNETHACFCLPKKNDCSDTTEVTGNTRCDLNLVACQHSTSGPNDCKLTITVTHTKYCVCTPKNKDDAIPCPKPNDLLIVLDSSESITPGDYTIAKEFINKLVTAMKVNKMSRVSFTTYSTNVRLEFGIANSLSSAEISSKILNAAHLADGTSTHLGITTALNDYKTAPRDALVNMVILTDGKSKDLTATADAIAEARNLRMQTYAVGIGSMVNQEELLMIAGRNSEGVFTKDTFSELVKILTPISGKLCSEQMVKQQHISSMSDLTNEIVKESYSK